MGRSNSNRDGAAFDAAASPIFTLPDDDPIIDTYGGTMSTGVAALLLGVPFIGCKCITLVLTIICILS